MKQIPLGRTGLTVSEYCLGTMTWGTQNTEAEAHAQIDYALDQGVNFWDTAEMYPVNPVRPETVGNTETIVGNWLAKGARDKVVLATKISGIGDMVRKGEGGITGATFRAALDGSLRRLQTDYIDLYQLHWPNRGSYHFRQIWGYKPGDNRAEVLENMAEVLDAADEAGNDLGFQFNIAAYSFCQHAFKLLALCSGHFFCGSRNGAFDTAMLGVELIEMSRSAYNLV